MTCSERMAAIHQPKVAYSDYDAMLADPKVEAVIIAIADQFHVAAAHAGHRGRQARAGRETAGHDDRVVPRAARPGGRGRSESCRSATTGGSTRASRSPASSSPRKWASASRSNRGTTIRSYRYTMTDNLQPIPITSTKALRPEGEPKADRRRYYLLTHGSHLVDTARFLGGPIAAVRARLLERFGSYCWFIAVDFEDGSLGHLDLQIPIKGDFQEGFQVFGENGSVSGRVHLPWFHKSSDVECFRASDRQFHRVLGEDAYTYKLQIEAFAGTILTRCAAGGCQPGRRPGRRAGDGGDRALGGNRQEG